mgnify:CR=1 FL=1
MNIIKAIDEDKKIKLQQRLIEQITDKRQEVKPDRAEMTFVEYHLFLLLKQRMVYGN